VPQWPRLPASLRSRSDPSTEAAVTLIERLRARLRVCDGSLGCFADSRGAAHKFDIWDAPRALLTLMREIKPVSTLTVFSTPDALWEASDLRVAHVAQNHTHPHELRTRTIRRRRS